jgi:hypothetical protein
MSPVLTPKDINRERLAEIGEELHRFTDETVVPIFKRMPGGEPVLTGTGCFFTCGGHVFLLTATHVFAALCKGDRLHDGPVQDTLAVPARTGTLFPISGRLFGTTDPILDISLLQLDRPELIRGHWNILNVGDVVRPGEEDKRGSYHLSGFPAQWFKRDGAVFTGERFHFFGLRDATNTLAHERPEGFVILPLDKSDLVTVKGHHVRVPELKGISGCPVWYLGSIHGRLRPRLAAVQTGYVERAPVLFIKSTHWGVVREVLKEFFPSELSVAERLIAP